MMRQGELGLDDCCSGHRLVDRSMIAKSKDGLPVLVHGNHAVIDDERVAVEPGGRLVRTSNGAMPRAGMRRPSK